MKNHAATIRLAIFRRDTERNDGSGRQTGERMTDMSIPPNLASIKPSLDKLQAIERELTASLIERDEYRRITARRCSMKSATWSFASMTCAAICRRSK
jgi:hypothetical protein